MQVIKGLLIVMLSVSAFVFVMRETSAILHNCSAFSEESCNWDDQSANPYW